MSGDQRSAGAWRSLVLAPQRIVVRRSELLAGAAEGSVFDAVAESAQRVLGADGALVSVEIDGSQRRVGASGLGLHEDAADIELFRRTLRRVEPLAIEDTCDSGDASEATKVRASMGVPLLVDDVAVGTLAVFSHAPRRWSDDDRLHLVTLSQWPVAELARIDTLARLHVAEAALTRATRVFDAMAEGVIGLDLEGRVALANPAAARMLGWQASDLIGQDLHAVAHFQRPDGAAYPHDQCPVLTTLEDGAARAARRETFWRRDGSPLHVDLSVGGLIDEGEVTAAILVFDDIEERLDVERMKDDFVSIVSHELRSPLAAVHGSLELIEDVADDPDATAQMLGIARRNTDRLGKLVDDILDLERASTGRLQLERSELHAVSLMEQASESVSGLAREGDVTLEVRPSDVTFWGDGRRVVQVLTNLASNAVRFSPQGGTVTLTAHRLDREVAIEVTDAGPGIPEEDQERIFDRFWQVPAGSPRGRRGSGLGLAIAQSMAHAHGGGVSVRSTVGAGSTFTLHVPVRARRSTVPVDRRTEDGRDPR